MNEKEAIDILKNDEEYITDSFYREFRTIIADKYTKAFRIVLNLIEKQQAEIEKKDKMINEMIGYIAELDVDEDICKNVDCDEYTDEETGDINCKHCIKQYFERKIEQ